MPPKWLTITVLAWLVAGLTLLVVVKALFG
jgi:hypothetical protein